MTKPCQGPDPEPRAPRLKAPAGACDCHAHIFGPLDRFPFDDNRAYTPPEASLESFRHMQGVLGIERAVIVHPSVHGTDNRASLAAIARLGARARGVAVIDESITDGELEQLHAGGMRGFRLNILFGGGPGLAAMETLAARVRPLGWHVQLLVAARDLPALAPRIAALPVEVVIDHIGLVNVEGGTDHPDFQTLVALARDGCWVKLSGAYRASKAGAPYADIAPYARALVEAAPTRMVWASDWPHPAHEGPMPNDGDLLDLLADWAPDPATQKTILVDNPAMLYGFDHDR